MDDHTPLSPPESIQYAMRNLLCTIQYTSQFMSAESQRTESQLKLARNLNHAKQIHIDTSPLVSAESQLELENDELKALDADFMKLYAQAQAKEAAMAKSMMHGPVKPEILRRNLFDLALLTSQYSELHDRIPPDVATLVKPKVLESLNAVSRLMGLEPELQNQNLTKKQQFNAYLEHLRAMLIVPAASISTVMAPHLHHSLEAGVVGAAGAGLSIFFAKHNFDAKTRDVVLKEKPAFKRVAYVTLGHLAVPAAVLAGAASAMSHNTVITMLTSAAVVATPVLFDLKEHLEYLKEKFPHQSQPSVSQIGEQIGETLREHSASQSADAWQRTLSRPTDSKERDPPRSR